MDHTVNALGKVVRATRKSKHISQEALAERIGVCKRTIIDIESNTGNPKFEVLFPLVRELDLPLNQVFYPEIPENFELKNMLLQEISNCSEYEIEIIFSLVKSLRGMLKNEGKLIE